MHRTKGNLSASQEISPGISSPSLRPSSSWTQTVPFPDCTGISPPSADASISRDPTGPYSAIWRTPNTQSLEYSVMTRLRTAAQVLVDQLVSNGIEHAFCVPGESFLPVLDALYDSPITVTVCRQEGGAAMMADAVGKATGKP